MTDLSNRKKASQRCRKCYRHLGGSVATNYFTWLVEKSFIKLQSSSRHNKIMVSVTNAGLIYFQFLDKEPYKLGNLISWGCLDGTEKKLHLAGGLGKLVLKYLLDNNVVQVTLNSRQLIEKRSALSFLIY